MLTKKTYFYIFILSFILLVLLADFYPIITDEYHYFLLSKSITQNHSIKISVYDFYRINNNLNKTQYANIYTFSRFPLGQPLLSVPIYCLIHKFKSLCKTKDYYFELNLIEIYNTLITCFIIIYLVKIIFYYTKNKKVSILLSYCFVFGSILIIYSKSFFSEPTISLLLIISTYLIITKNILYKKKYIIIFSTIFGWLILTKFIYILFIPIFLLYALLKDDKNKTSYIHNISIGTIIIVIFILLCLFYNYIRTKDFFDFYYPKYYNVSLNGTNQYFLQSFSNPLLRGLYGNLFTLSKSIFITSPILFLSLFAFYRFYKKHRKDCYFIASLILFHFYIFSIFSVWEGGLCWGPRFLIPTIPLFAILSYPIFTKFYYKNLIYKYLTILVLIFSISFQLFVCLQDPLITIIKNNIVYGSGKYYNMSLNPYKHMLKKYPIIIKNTIRLYSENKPLTPDISARNILTYDKILNLWWLKLYLAGKFKNYILTMLLASVFIITFSIKKIFYN